MVTEEGMSTTARYQMAEVMRPLSAVSKICDQGSRVVFEKHGGYIESLIDGQRTEYKSENNVYILGMWIWRPGSSDFPRPSR